MIRVIHGEIWSENFIELDQLINDFQSCVRFAYCRFSKDKIDFNDVRSLAKIHYTTLNSAQVADAVLQGQTSYNTLLAQQKELAKVKKQIEDELKKKKLTKRQRRKLEKRLKCVKYKLKNPSTVFGGKKAWKDFRSGKISKVEWLKSKNNQIYARGSKNSIGNQIIRIVGNTLRITVGHKKWVYYKLFISEKFKTRLKILLDSGQAYNIRLIRKDDNHFNVKIDYKLENPVPTIDFSNGIIGVDTNPDRIAVADVSVDGNLITTKTFPNYRILYASAHKRNYDIGCLVKDVINYAKSRNKGISFENLKFDKDYKESSKKWNRIKSQFVWKKFITLLESKCVEHGIQYTNVNPAYTSIIGNLKYRWMHKVSIHEAAAYVIGRRGLKFNEKLSFYKLSQERVKSFILGTHAGKYKRNKRIHSWRLWKELNDKREAVLTGLRVRLADLKEFVGHIRNKSATLLGEVFLQELFVGSQVGNNLPIQESVSIHL